MKTLPLSRIALGVGLVLMLALMTVVTAAQDTPIPPTPLPGRPSLVAQNIQIQPSPVQAGDQFAATFTVTNIGNRTSIGGVVSIDTSGKFLPGGTESVVRLPDLAPGLAFVVALNGVVIGDAPAGPNLLTLKFSYTDFSAERYESTSTATVIIQNAPQASQVTVTGYRIAPDPVQPGQPATLTIEVTNSGTAPAVQALLRVNGGEGAVLLAGPSGDSFPLGDLAPGETKSIDALLTVSASAKAGPQPQGVTVTYLLNGEAKEATGSLTLAVAPADLREALILLSSYSLDRDPLSPGDDFTMTLTLSNVGKSDASDLLVTFGTVTETDSSTGGSGGSTTTPSTTFAPLGTGGTVFVGDLAADGGNIEISQAFIVDGGVKSGVYGLPLTLRYVDAAGEVKTRALSASLIVLVPPQLRFVDTAPVVPEMSVGDMVSIAWTVINDGKNDVNLRSVRISAENAEVIEGAEQFIGTKKTTEEAQIAGTVMIAGEGPVVVTVTIDYLDELNRSRQIVRTIETTGVVYEIPVDPGFPTEPEFPTPEPTPEPEADPTDLLGRFLRGLLGFGS
jgi:hypothetical protein